MPELNGRDLLSEWRGVMESLVTGAASAAGRTELPGDLMRLMQRQVELVQEVVDSDRRGQGTVVGSLFAPVDAIFDLLEASGAALRNQAEAMDSAGRAMQEAAALVKSQAELFERMTTTLRQPTDFVKGATRRQEASGAARAKRAPSKPAAKKPARAPKKKA